jgi:hypothetical protein
MQPQAALAHASLLVRLPLLTAAAFIATFPLPVADCLTPLGDWISGRATFYGGAPDGAHFHWPTAGMSILCMAAAECGDQFCTSYWTDCILVGSAVMGTAELDDLSMPHGGIH